MNKIEINESNWRKHFPFATMEFKTFVDGAYSNYKTKRKPNSFRTMRYIYAEDVIDAIEKRTKAIKNKESEKMKKCLLNYDRMINKAKKILDMENNQ